MSRQLEQQLAAALLLERAWTVHLSKRPAAVHHLAQHCQRLKLRRAGHRTTHSTPYIATITDRIVL